MMKIFGVIYLWFHINKLLLFKFIFATLFMEQYIINRKQIVLEKNKEFSFKIPVAIKPLDCEFQIETSYFEQTEPFTIILNLKGIKGGSENKVIQIPVEMENSSSKFNLSGFNSELSNEDYLLIGCISNRNISVALSILRNYERFIG